MTAVTPTDRPKSVRNSCVIKVFGGVFILSRCFLDCSVGVGVFVTGLSQISSFFSVMIEQNVVFIWRPPYELLGGTHKVIWRTLYDEFIWWLSYMHVAYFDSVYSIRAFHFVRKVVSLKCILIFWQTVPWQYMKIDPIQPCTTHHRYHEIYSCILASLHLFQSCV